MKVNIPAAGLESRGIKQRIKFGIGDASVIIDLLRNKLYANPIRTLVQEYICNARDAHREVNSDKKLEIGCPTILNPTFYVRDYGPGVSPERFSNVFCLYGESTKRQDNIQTGGFGIGAKSAWSYTDSFSVTTYINGIQRDYVCHIGDNNEGDADLISEINTDEPNGTKIQISVAKQNIDEFRKAIVRATLFWKNQCNVTGIRLEDYPDIKPKEIFIHDGKEIAYLYDKQDISKYIDTTDSTLILIDGIPYTTDNHEHLLFKKENPCKFLNYYSCLVLNFNVGEINVAATRESVSFDEATYNITSDSGKIICSKIKSMINGYLKDCDTTEKLFASYKQLVKIYEYKIIEEELNKVFKSTGYKEYKIQYSHIYSEKFKDIETATTFTLSNRTNKISKKTDYKNNITIPLDLINQIYYLDITESENKIKKRIKAKIQELKDQKNLLLIEFTSNNLDIIRDFGILPISSLQIPKINRIGGFRKNNLPKKKPTEISINKYVQSTRSIIKQLETIDLSNNNSKFVYVDLNQSEFSLLEIKIDNNLIDFLQKEGFILCGITQRFIKNIKNDKNFIELKEFINNFKIDEGQINKEIYRHLNYDYAQKLECISIIGPIEGINDNRFKNIYNKLNELIKVKENYDYICMPNIFKIKYKEQINEKMIEFIKIIGQYNLLQEEYPILKIINVESNSYINKELVFYINGKFDQIKQLKKGS